MPKFFVTAFDMLNERTAVFGNLGSLGTLSEGTGAAAVATTVTATATATASNDSSLVPPASPTAAAADGDAVMVSTPVSSSSSSSSSQTAGAATGGQPHQQQRFGRLAAAGVAPVDIRSAEHVPMVQAGLATSAAPLYFPPISIDDDIFADGGVLSNCPVGESLAVVDAIFPRRNLELLVSLGCGTWISDEEKDAARGLTTEQQQRQARQARATGRGAGEWIQVRPARQSSLPGRTRR
jgi:hypothetical protein